MNKEEVKEILLELLEEDEMVFDKLKNKFRKLMDKDTHLLESKQLDSEPLQGGGFMEFKEEIKTLKAVGYWFLMM